jgi:hypothetical protein
MHEISNKIKLCLNEIEILNTNTMICVKFKKIGELIISMVCVVTDPRS